MAALSTGRQIDPELIRSVHWTLTKSRRGAHLTPGKLRDEQNWVGASLRSTLSTSRRHFPRT